AVHFSSVPERFMVGVWVAMEDIDETTGPVEYVAGSHRWPIMNNTVLGRRGWKQELASAQDPYGPAWAALVRAHGAQATRFLPRKGQALIWCANLLHGGTAQTNPRRTRWSQVTHYYFDDCIYYTPAFSDEPLGRLRLRKLVDIADGTRKPNLYLGEEIVTIPDPVHFHVIPKKSIHKRVGRAVRRWLRRTP
ncbi:MAG: phytanoyl-CoA dioxygenase family protein, partial [Sphingomonadales bacterium]|nr:phytanoyl-CoA dioxygenase family protein [Sphingomonadales bacterium]